MRPSLLVIAWLGLLISGYLFITYISPVPLVCGTGGCHDIQASLYAKHFGLPTPLYGIIYYFLLGILAVLWRPNAGWWLRWSLIVLTGVGFGVTLWLTYLEAFVIKAWCTWCVGSAVLATLAFIITWRQAKSNY